MEMLYQRGPQSRPRASYNKTGIGQFKQVRSNPISWGFDCMGNCFPMLTLRGGQDETTQQVRNAVASGIRPTQTYLQSRGVVGISESADDYGIGSSGASPLSAPVSDSPSGSQQGSVVGADSSGNCPVGTVQRAVRGGASICQRTFGYVGR